MEAEGAIDTQSHGEVCYVTVRCHNRAGLAGEKTSIGLPFMTRPPDSSLARVDISLSPQTLYGNKGHYQSSNTSVKFSWFGFRDPVGIAHYEVTVRGHDLSLNWINVGKYRQAEVSNLRLTSGHKYEVYVRAVNYGGLASKVVVTKFTVLREAPMKTGTVTVLFVSIVVAKFNIF